MHLFHTPLTALALTFSLLIVGCDGDDTTGTPPTTGSAPDGGSSTNKPPPAPDAITEAVLAACPQSATLIDSTEWPSCLAGRRVVGTEPFNNSACELKIGQNGAFEYSRAGALALSVPDRSSWKSPTGSYQNQLDGAGRRLFLAGVDPDLPMVEGQPRVTGVKLSFISLADDKVEIEYLDASLRRQTYTCQVNVL